MNIFEISSRIYGKSVDHLLVQEFSGLCSFWRPGFLGRCVFGGGDGGGHSGGRGIGGALVGTAAALLGSTNNPLRGIFK